MQKILVIRFSSIGDIVLTTPVLRCLKLQKNAEIHYLTKSSFAGIIAGNPHVAKVHSINKHVNEIIGDLKKENFDYIIDLHNNLRSAQVKRALRKPSSTFRKLNLRKWLLVNFKIDLMPALHVADRYLETIASLGVHNDGNGLDYFIPEADEVSLLTLPPSCQRGFIAFVIGAKHSTKKLPPEKIISICKKLELPVLLIGGKEDAATAMMIAESAGPTVHNCCGKFNLNQSASLVRQATRVISHDTGLMHIAAAFRKDITSVWGNTVPQFGFTPYLPGKNSVMLEVKDLPCRPCSKIGYEACPERHFRCMRNIDESGFLR